ncbi:MAG: SpoIIE family protein phosphatase [Magnetococcales bacterium]|nr:SpoIIE family protein phosphatase [Magnetococcales bacterium]
MQEPWIVNKFSASTILINLISSDNDMDDSGTILIVDDTPANIDILTELLSDNYKTKIATNGFKALKLAAATPSPDLILLDIMMPEMDGYEVCRQLKSEEATRGIPVIFLTAKAEVEDETRGLAIGAVDYITKPISLPIVLERVKTHLKLRNANRRLSEAYKELDKLNAVLVEERDFIETVVSKIQQSPLLDTSYLRILEKPVDKTTGDIVCAASCPNGARRVMLGDFTGHGLTAAIGGPLVSEIFYSETRTGVSIEVMFKTLNKRLLHALPVEMFMACSCIELDAEKMQLTMFNAGMTSILILRDGKVIHKEQSNFAPRGLMDIPDDKSTTLSVQKNDRVVMCTDGLEETTNPNGEMFGEERFVQLIEQTLLKERPLDFIIEAIQGYHQSGSLADDISLVEFTC